MAPQYHRPELLAPAGNPEMMHAAIENGADAIYFGLEDFNARMRAGNFSVTELPAMQAELHQRGMKGYVCLNTLVFPSELDEAARLLLACNGAGADAVLVQDLGVAALAARLTPELPIHASTQMTLTCGEAVEAARALGLRPTRVIVARETSLKELDIYRKTTDVELEIFVHGALCVAYSGQCLTSEALGGRSANRGECAQACRLPYELYVDGKPFDTGAARYPLSPKDLSAYEDIDKLIEGGISSLKIEGRLKTPQYVAATVQSYRKAIDQAFGGARPQMDDDTRYKLEMTFSRGFTPGYLREINHQEVVDARFPKKRGVYLGRVKAIRGESIDIALENPLKPGDGIVFDAGRPEEDEEGGRVYSVTSRPRGISELCFGNHALNLRRIHAGDRVWKTSDPHIDSELAASYDGDQIRFRRPIRATLTASIGSPAKLIFEDAFGHRAEVEDEIASEPAQNRPLTREAAKKQIGRLGGTPFELAELQLELEGELMIPFSRLNDLRRRAVDELLKLCRATNLGRPSKPEALGEMRAEVAAVSIRNPQSEIRNGMSALCRTLAQVEAAAGHESVATVYTDFENLRDHESAKALIRAAGKEFVPATLRIMKPGESGLVRRLLALEPDAVLVRSLGAMHVLKRLQPELRIYADYSLNVSNELTASLLIRAGVNRLTPSYDLNIDQLLDLLRAAPASWFEVTIHQHLPMFHMEHCVFCRFLSDGTDHTNCGRPCESHTLELLDRKGYRHPVAADCACRNTVYNAVAQSASEYLGMMHKAGVCAYRVELLNETAGQTTTALDLYSSAVNGSVSGHALWQTLHASSKLGVTRGSLDSKSRE